MQCIVTDERGAYVKAAIVNLIRAKDSEDGSGAVDVTYAETDEEGRFVIKDLNPDEKYIIEIRVEVPETAVWITEAKEKKETETEVESEEKVAEPEWEEKIEAVPESVEKIEAVPEPETIKAAETEPEPEIVKTEPVKAAAEPAPAVTASVLEPYYDPYDPDPEDEQYLDSIEEEDTYGDIAFIDSLERNNMIEDTIRENISFGNLCGGKGFNPKDKPYLIKNNLW